MRVSPRRSAPAGLEITGARDHESYMAEQQPVNAGPMNAGDASFYARLSPVFREYVDTLVGQVSTLLWPERRAALSAFYRGVAGTAPELLRASVDELGVPLNQSDDMAEHIFRAVLTAWIERIGADDITNPDQAALYALSFRADHVESAEVWFAERPEHLAAISAGVRDA